MRRCTGCQQHRHDDDNDRNNSSSSSCCDKCDATRGWFVSCQQAHALDSVVRTGVGFACPSAVSQCGLGGQPVRFPPSSTSLFMCCPPVNNKTHFFVQ
eukprot:38762-Chlamydomonas_euryale.AAC.3